MTRTLRLTSVLWAAACMLCATETKTWTQDEYSSFEKGDLKKLSLSSDGRLSLAPVVREVLDSSSVYLWALAEDSKGNLYAGGGGPGGPAGARVYVISKDGKGKPLAQFEDDLEVHAIAVDSRDRVYAGTAPDGKVYRITAAGKPEVFFDPKAKYIWAMAFDSHGDLFVATGDRGEIYRVSPDGKGQVFYKTSETHARSLALDASGNLIVGTEPGGLVLRISPKGEGFVLHQTAKREITAVAVAKNGAIYAAGVGNKTGVTALGLTPGGPRPGGEAATPPAATPAAPGAPGGQLSTRPAAPVPPVPVPAPAPIAGGSEVYRIEKDGYPRRVWSHAQHIAYAIGFDQDQRALIGTGNKGIIYRLDSDLVYTELLNAPPTQVTALYAGASGRMFAATGNVGKVYQIGPGSEKEGTLESDVLDANMFSYWGRLSFRGTLSGGRVSITTRSGNLDRPQNDWSPWSEAITSAEGARATSPPARFVQWRATLQASADGTSPELRGVSLAYLPKNVAPVVLKIEMTPANYRFPPQVQLTISTPRNLSLPPIGRPARSSTPPAIGDSGGASMQYAKDSLGARWAASDENGDTLLYTVEIKGEGESAWKPLKEKLNDQHLSWDGAAFPDGDYRIRVSASDSPANPPDQALLGTLVSDAFTIDNTPPAITGLTASAAGNKVQLRWKAADALSLISKAEYSINGGEWIPADPDGRLTDSREEDYALTIDRPAPGELTIAVRVADEFDNQSVAKVVAP